MRPYVFTGGTAVVTGAAGGIGAALAAGLAERGSHLALLDRDAAGLDGVAAALRAAHPGAVVRTYVVDLADRAATARAAEAVLADHERLTLVVNNAGVALGGYFSQLTLEEFDWLLEINLRATVQLTHAFLPSLRASPGSHLANVSSLFGLVAPPGQSAYATSKFAVRGFTEALRAELVPDGVGVTCVHPGGIATGIARNARTAASISADEASAGAEAFEKLLTISPDDAAEAILRAVQRRRPRVLIGWSARLPDALARLAPGSYSRLLAVGDRVLRRS